MYTFFLSPPLFSPPLSFTFRALISSERREQRLQLCESHVITGMGGGLNEMVFPGNMCYVYVVKF